MLDNESILAGLVLVVAEGLREEYGIDPEPLLEEVGISLQDISRPGARIETHRVDQLWQKVFEVTGDSEVGLKIGQRASPGDYYVLGHAWFASETLGDALERYARYSSVIDTVDVTVTLTKEGDVYRFGGDYKDVEDRPSEIAVDAEIAAFLAMCAAVKERPVRLHKVERQEDESMHPGSFEAFVGCPVSWGAKEVALYFPADEIEEHLQFAIPEVAAATDQIAERYIESLDRNTVATQVRRLLIQMLPSGSADQESIASKLYRSASTLQRQLSAEGTSYRDVLEATRRSMAQDYLRNGEHTHAQVAYMLGFSDQSNFARAFKRWTGHSPGQYQKERG